MQCEVPENLPESLRGNVLGVWRSNITSKRERRWEEIHSRMGALIQREVFEQIGSVLGG